MKKNPIKRLLVYVYRKLEALDLQRRRDEFMRMGNISSSVVFHEKVSITKLNNDKNSLTIGNYTHIRGNIFIYHHGKVKIGEYCYMGENSQIWSSKSISIGNRVLVAHNVNIVDNTSHPIDALKRHEHYKAIITEGFPEDDLSGQEIVIEDDAWINENVVIMRGVRIGRGAIVGAGSIVTRDVPPNTFVCGNPAKVVKQI